MKFHKKDTTIERRLLIGLVVSSSFCKKIIPILEPEYLEIPAAANVAGWCVEHYQKYNEAPGSTIQEIYREKSRRVKEGEVEWIEEFLSGLSDEYEKKGLNEEYLFDNCVEYFKRQRLWKAASRVQELLEDGKYDLAREVWVDSITIPRTDDLGINPLDPVVIRKLLEKKEARISFSLGIPNLDKMTGPVKSGWLAVFMGPMKRGKTWALVYTAIVAAMKGLNVVFISLESEELDNAMRFWMGIGSLSSSEEELKFPYFVDKEKGDDVRHKEVERPRAEEHRIVGAAELFSRAVGSARLRLKTYPMGTAGISNVKNYLDVLETYEGFSPHVVVVDYLGIMKRSKGAREEDKIDQNSMALKALAQERKIIVVSAHQATREAIEKISMSPVDTSRDIRLRANVDILYGLNQTDREMDENVMRISVLDHRHHKFTRRREVKVLQQFEAGQFALDSMVVERPTKFDMKKGGKEDEV